MIPDLSIVLDFIGIAIIIYGLNFFYTYGDRK